MLTPCPRHLRDMGYLRELLDVRRTSHHCAYSWAPHLRRSQAIIRAAMELCPQRRKAVIFGSGMLNDVPIDDLAATFREVVLVDILHPRGTQRRTRHWPNVRPLAADVTGAVEAAYQVARDPVQKLPHPKPALFCDDAEVDLVASVNLLCQLPYLPVTYLRRLGVHPDIHIDAFGRDLVQSHLDYLRRLPGVVALIADVEVRMVTRAGNVIEQRSTVHGVELPWAGESWTWRLVPCVESTSGRGQQRRVIGIPDIKRAEPLA